MLLLLINHETRWISQSTYNHERKNMIFFVYILSQSSNMHCFISSLEIIKQVSLAIIKNQFFELGTQVW